MKNLSLESRRNFMILGATLSLSVFLILIIFYDKVSTNQKMSPTSIMTSEGDYVSFLYSTTTMFAFLLFLSASFGVAFFQKRLNRT